MLFDQYVHQSPVPVVRRDANRVASIIGSLVGGVSDGESSERQTREIRARGHDQRRYRAFVRGKAGIRLQNRLPSVQLLLARVFPKGGGWRCIVILFILEVRMPIVSGFLVALSPRILRPMAICEARTATVMVVVRWWTWQRDALRLACASPARTSIQRCGTRLGSTRGLSWPGRLALSARTRRGIGGPTRRPARPPSYSERLDFDFYKFIRDKYVLPRNLAQVSLAELSHEVGALWVAWARHSGSSPQAAPGEAAHSSALASGAAGGAEGAADAEVIKRIFQKLDFVEAYIRMEIKKKNAAYCAPAELSPEEQHSLSLCFVFQQAAEEGAAAFAGAAERYGAPAVLHGDRGSAGGIDLSAYGFAVDWPGASDDSDDSDDEALGEIGELKRQVEDMAAWRGVSFTHASLEPQPEAVPPTATLPQPARGCRSPADTGPYVHGPDGLAYGLTFAGDHSHVATGEPTPVGMHRLGITPGDTSEDEDYDSDEADKEFDDKLAADKTAYVTGNVAAAAPSSGGGSGLRRWAVSLCILHAQVAAGGAYPPAGFHTECVGLWGMPLGRTRERSVAGGASHFPNPPYDDSPPPPLDALADLLPVALEPDVLAAYQRGFLAALRLRDSPQAVPGVGGTAAGDALRTVVPPSGGEIYELAAGIDVPGDEDGAVAVDAGADSEYFEI
ncbi:hypothetical protein CYMTET_24633 [Cymbomonas tetramitiformis]|uniref:Uncharacterized protein n=1 Tax=Cymbomonas tetramitiformis TaxID=36881 RepID=A0AAE0FVI2_9CHLO|nr:hypothetical protein CYMTET_24633 [Cymbomonas tetramitiformis]